MTSTTYSKMTHSPTYASLNQFQFRGRRMYDMCMIFHYKTSRDVMFDEGEDVDGPKLNPPSNEELATMESWKVQRESILKSMQNCGLECYCYYNRDRSKIITKIGAGAEKLRNCAARMKFKLLLKAEYLHAYAEYRNDFEGTPEMNFTDRRVVSHLYQNHSGADFATADSIFSQIDKIMIIHHIITSKDKDCAGINVADLLYKKDSHLLCYFPLHDASRLQEMKRFSDWCFMGEEHVSKVRDYFGDKVGFYFLWLSFYFKWIIPLALIGIVLQLIDVCFRTPSNITAVPFCVLLSVWSLLLPHFWRRTQSKYAICWGSFDLKDQFEPYRPEYRGDGDFRLNPITFQVEPFYPWQRRIWDYMRSTIVILFSGILLSLVILGLLFARHQYKGTHDVVLFQIALAAVVEFNNFVLSRIASYLTRMENHRLQSEHDYHLLAKSIGLKVVNSFFALYYIAFFKQHSYLFGAPMVCYRNDCFLDLQSQLAIFVLFRLSIGNALEFAMPRVKAIWRNTTSTDRKQVQARFFGGSAVELAAMSPPEKQAHKDDYDTFAEFDETLVSHGYATLFSVTSPFVLLAALVAIVLEIYVDMRAITESKRRVLPQRCRDNEPWSTAFEIYGVFAAFTNVLLLVFASGIYNGWTLTERLVLFLYLEQAIFLSRMLIVFIFPAVPRSVEYLKMKQDIVVHRAINNIKGDSSEDYSRFREHHMVHFDIFEQDKVEDEEEAEPELDLGHSSRTLYRGIVDNTRSYLPSRQ